MNPSFPKADTKPKFPCDFLFNMSGSSAYVSVKATTPKAVKFLPAITHHNRKVELTLHRRDVESLARCLRNEGFEVHFR